MPNDLERQSGGETLTREEQFEKLLNDYRCYYDVTREFPVGDMVFPAMAEFHSRSEKYVLVKKAKIWGMEMNEYVYFLLADRLEPEMLRHAVDLAREDGLGRIKPHSEHMYSHVSLSIIAQEIPLTVKNVAGNQNGAADYKNQYCIHLFFLLSLVYCVRFCSSVFRTSFPAGLLISPPLERSNAAMRNSIQPWSDSRKFL